MSGLCGIVSLDGHQVSRLQLDSMVIKCRHRAADGVFYHHQPGLGLACLSTDSSPDGTGGCRPDVFQQGRWVFAADARLDNRASCLGWQPSGFSDNQASPDSRLMFGTLLSDLQQGPGRLVGDFAYVLWDAARGTLRLARDAMGMRSLYYRVEPGRILFATELGQILAVEGVTRRPNRHAMAWHLSDMQTPPGTTFYEGIDEVLPGEQVEIDARGAVSRRVIWHPDPDHQLRFRDSREYAEQFRSLLVEAVRCRTRVASPAAMGLSGGMDSGSIASIAGWLAEHGHDVPAFRAYSWAFTQHPECDERENIYRIADRFGIPVTEIPAEQTYPLLEMAPYLPDEDGPFTLIYQGFVDRLLNEAYADGCRSAWFGYRGDVVIGGLIPDVTGLARERHWHAARRELAGLRCGFRLSRPRALWRYGVKPLLSDGLDAMVGTSRSRSLGDDFVALFAPRDRLPPFVTASFAASAGLPERDPIVEASSRWRYRTQRERYRQTFSPLVMSVMRLSEQRCARLGMAMVDPWSDRRLAAFVMSCPAHEVDRFREPKRLARRAMRGIMPDEAILASRKVLPSPLYEHSLRHVAHETVLGLMTNSRSADLGIIEEVEFRQLFLRHCRGEHQNVEFWPAISLELWLRRWWA